MGPPRRLKTRKGNPFPSSQAVFASPLRNESDTKTENSPPLHRPNSPPTDSTPTPSTHSLQTPMDQHTRLMSPSEVKQLYTVQSGHLTSPLKGQAPFHSSSVASVSLFCRLRLHLLVSLLLSILGSLFLLSLPSMTSLAHASSAPEGVLPLSLAPPPRRLRATEDLPQALEELLNVGGGTSLFIGVFLTLIGSVMMAGGSTMMKVGLHLEAEKSKTSTSLMCEPMWIAGFAAYTFGALMHVVALAFAPASVLAPMNSIGLIANAVTAAVRTTSTPAISEEEVGLYSWRDPWYLAYLACCVVPGFGTLIYVNSEESAVLEERERIILSSSSSHHKNKRIELTTTTSNASRLSSLAKGGGDDGGLSPPSGLDGRESSSSSSGQGGTSDPSLDVQGNDEARRALLEGGVGSEADSQDEVQERKTSSYPRCIGLCYGFLAGLTGAQCVLELKELAACVHRGMSDFSIWYHPQPYLVVVFLIASVWTQIHFLNLGLARGDATLVVPTYYVSWTFFGTLGGFAKFHEIQGFSVGAIVLFALGFGLTILCIAILAVQEMTSLRRYVDERVPDFAEQEVDLPTQELQEQQLAKQVTLAMGLFPFSMLGRTVGRRRFRPLYQRFRRTRSTASDTALNDSYGELTLSSAGVMGAYTLPHNLHFNRSGSETAGWDSRIRRGGGDEPPIVGGVYRHTSPYTDATLGPSPFSRHLAAAQFLRSQAQPTTGNLGGGPGPSPRGDSPAGGGGGIRSSNSNSEREERHDGGGVGGHHPHHYAYQHHHGSLLQPPSSSMTTSSTGFASRPQFPEPVPNSSRGTARAWELGQPATSSKSTARPTDYRVISPQRNAGGIQGSLSSATQQPVSGGSSGQVTAGRGGPLPTRTASSGSRHVSLNT
ncbi:duf803 domain-containing protein [Cystoisospora suis]|uniref:Duf803 domain-containing protein n=1 Tax=Cystoisospora suis TaxID=483139 RepID=A0A2C6L7L3_9APIC|nr:duf803 domain-containing protein [Cystoisospora suis]